jgi:hypothetical protein
MRRALVLSLCILSIAHASLAAQSCRGLAPFSTGPYRVTGEGSLTLESNAVGAGMGVGLPQGIFGDAAIATRSSESFNGSSVELAVSAGYEIEVGRFQLCPVGSAGLGMGPSKSFGNGEDRSSRTAQLGVSLGTSLGTTNRWQWVPSLALSFTYRQDAAHNFAGTTLFAISDYYAMTQLGLGFVMRNLTIRPHLDLPLSLQSGDPTLGLTVGYNFGRRSRETVP